MKQKHNCFFGSLNNKSEKCFYILKVQLTAVQVDGSEKDFIFLGTDCEYLSIPILITAQSIFFAENL